MGELPLRWDPRKARINLEKHGVSFEEAANAVDDPFAVVRSDEQHSIDENRFLLVGENGAGRTLTVIFTVRAESAWIISARKSTQRRRYMEDEPTIHDAPVEDEMLGEYGHLKGWRRNPFRFTRAEGAVLLDPDVREVFRTSEEVNAALRLLIAKGRIPSDASRK